jgi:hypothetical protein
MSENKIESLELIESKIYTIRGMQVMLDKDLAAFYKKSIEGDVPQNMIREK